MHHMQSASVRDLRYRFAQVERLLREGEEIQITKRKRVIARLTPAEKPMSGKWPDFLERLRKIYGNKKLKVSGAQLLAKERDRY